MILRLAVLQTSVMLIIEYRRRVQQAYEFYPPNGFSLLSLLRDGARACGRGLDCRGCRDMMKYRFLSILSLPAGVCGTVGCESALRSAGTLLSRVRAPPPAPGPDGGP
ncbi:hypothetical protein PoB_004786000 [Plakobranchus ocellatus]|uniref:Uncharacterized protein n=1 Tax=Plakobranchus ocellatus TaxID=259542 RepID=A0AAV4BLE4_9GAST|nr:hypothetical protein PoB_004786000 [Plakobranchus ocellatus]